MAMDIQQIVHTTNKKMKQQAVKKIAKRIVVKSVIVPVAIRAVFTKLLTKKMKQLYRKTNMNYRILVVIFVDLVDRWIKMYGKT